MFLPFLFLTKPPGEAVSHWLMTTLLWHVVVATLFGLLLGYAAGKLLKAADISYLLDEIPAGMLLIAQPAGTPERAITQLSATALDAVVSPQTRDEFLIAIPSLRLAFSFFPSGPAFFVWLSVFNLFVVSVFWSFMADIYSDIEARRLYGFIAAGGTAGVFLGGVITEWISWRWTFLINVPVGLVVLAAVPALVPRIGGRRDVRLAIGDVVEFCIRRVGTCCSVFSETDLTLKTEVVSIGSSKALLFFAVGSTYVQPPPCFGSATIVSRA